MAGYWPSSFFCVFMDRDEVEVHKLAKKERGQYPAILTEQTWSIKDLLYGRARSLHLARSRSSPYNNMCYYMASSVSGQDEPNRAL